MRLTTSVGIGAGVCGKGSTGWTFQVNNSGYLEWVDNAYIINY
jgi:hypothetical protein